MLRLPPRVLCAVLVAAVVLRVSADEPSKLSANESPNEQEELSLPDDPLRPFWMANLERLIPGLGIKDNTEAGLLLLGNPNLKVEKPPDYGSVSSMAIFRNGESETISKEYEMRSGDEVTRFRRIITRSVRSPIAIRTTAYCVNGRPQLAETFYCLDEKGRWLECSSGRAKVNPPRFDFSQFFHDRSRREADPRGNGSDKVEQH